MTVAHNVFNSLHEQFICFEQFELFEQFLYFFVNICFQGYFGAAIGKAKQNAKTEIEKLKLKDLTCRQLVKEAAKMLVTCNCYEI